MAQREFLFHILFHSQDVAIKLPQYTKPVVAWQKCASAGCPHLEETWFPLSWPLNLASRRQPTWPTMPAELVLGLAGLARRVARCSSCSNELARSPETTYNTQSRISSASILLHDFWHPAPKNHIRLKGLALA